MPLDPAVTAGAHLLRSQIVEHQHETLTSLTEQAVVFDSGVSFRSRALPLVWTLNQVRLTGPALVEEVSVISERFQFELPYRHVVVEGGRFDDPLAEELAAAGWSIEHDLLMAMTFFVPREIDTSRVVALDERHMLSLMRDWLLEERDDATDDGILQVLEYNRREGEFFDEHRLGVVQDGAPVAVTKLREDGRIAWVEDVYTSPIARGHGHSRTLLEATLRLAWDSNPDFAYIVADDDDWPQQFYARAGFQPVGVNTILHRSVR